MANLSQSNISDIETVVAVTLTSLGVISGDITLRAAIRKYGPWVKDAVRDGRLKATRIGNSTSPTRRATCWYSIAEILALRASDMHAAERIINL